ncbi:MAG: hypothetical protein HKM05_01585 [Spirochaetales bacterium]|nr:hypothetical protein [Spirochaetales bacterium]
MSKNAASLFQLPFIRLTGQPYKKHPEDKLYWVDFEFEGPEFRLADLAILESGRWLEVRAVHHDDSKHALQFKGVPEKVMQSGRRLYEANWPVSYERKAYLVPLGAQNRRLKDSQVRLKADLLDPEGVSVHLKWIDAPSGKFLATVSAERRFPCLIGATYQLENDKGETLDLVLLTAGTVTARDLADYLTKTFRFPGQPSTKALYSVNLRVNGWTILPPPLWAEEFEESEGEQGVRVMRKALDHFSKKMRNACAQPGGLDETALKERMALPPAVFRYLAFRLVQSSQLRKKDDWYLPVGSPESFLSPLAKGILGRLGSQGVAGMDLSTMTDTLLRVTLLQLARMDLAVLTESPWVYSLEAWNEIRHRLCGPGRLGTAWKIVEVKEVLGCSRKPLLGVLNKLEEEGYLNWRDDARVVIRETTNPLESTGVEAP